MGRPSIPKLLGKLTSKVARFEPPSTGGTREITPEDVAATLGMMPRQSAILLRAKWTLDMSAARSLVEYMLAKSERRLSHRRWRPRSGRTIARLVWVVMMEMEIVKPCRTNPDGYEIGAAKCGGCHGIGWRFSRKLEKRVQCPRCGGSGQHMMSGRERAGRCGMDHKNWNRNWEDLHQWIMADLNHAQLIGMRIAARKLRDDE